MTLRESDECQDPQTCIFCGDIDPMYVYRICTMRDVVCMDCADEMGDRDDAGGNVPDPTECFGEMDCLD